MYKGQMEIFGLVIIVILVSLGLLFAVVILTKTPVQQVQQLKESVQASNLLHAAMGTTIPDCGKRTLREAVQDCALASVSGTTVVGASNCAGVSTCEKADQVFKIMFEDTIQMWGRDYEFFISGTETVERIHSNEGACPPTEVREGTVRTEKVRTGLDINLTLYLC